MKSFSKILTLLFVFGLLSAGAVAQETCYNKKLGEAKKLFASGNYNHAREVFADAKKCNDKPANANNTLDTWISKCDDAILDMADDDDASTDAVLTINVGSVSFRMIRVDGGSFLMGCTAEQGDDCQEDEKNVHSVTLRSYYISETEVTQALWSAVMDEEPSYFVGEDLPVENVSFKDAEAFISRLNSLTGMSFRMPSEAEWEYAARGGKKSKGYKFSGGNNIDVVAWYFSNSNGQTHPVAKKRPNELGIYDMCGNVWEWCGDWYRSNYSNGRAVNPKGPSSGKVRVCRGGGWFSEQKACRMANRGNDSSSRRDNRIGVRLAL